jgi:arsenate reductase-like glutaredoxin family protein
MGNEHQFSLDNSVWLNSSSTKNQPAQLVVRRMMILKESGVDFEAINYFIDPIPKKKLKELLGKMKLSAKISSARKSRSTGS